MEIPKSKEIIKLLKSSNGRPMRSKEISRRLGMPKEDRTILKKVLRKMISQDKICRVEGGKYAITEYKNVKPKTTENANKTQRVATSTRLKGVAKDGRLIGKFVRTGKTGKIIPRDGLIPHIILEPADIKELRNNSLVVAELQNKISTSGRLRGKVLDVLGKAGDITAEKKGLLIEYDLTEVFPNNINIELDNIAEQIPPAEIKRRVDLRSRTIFTIDGEDAKDFDDAVGIEKTKSGHKLWVCIADVSYYVKMGSAIDNEALSRATSVYLPDRVIPMLPEKLSNNLCSLVPSEDRLTKTAEMDFNPKGEMVGFKMYNSVINSSARLTYTQVVEDLSQKPPISKELKDVFPVLKEMKELYEKIRKHRIESGKLDFDIPEPNLIRDELGRVVDVIKSKRNFAHEMIEEFMIAANVAVASHLCDSGGPSIYRIHETPDADSLIKLKEGLKKLGYMLSASDDINTHDLQNIINQSKGKSEEVPVNMLILRSLKRAFYSVLDEEHFGLALIHYTHFTSPIRRYPDLIVHRILDSLFLKKSPPYDEKTVEWIAEHSSKRERLANEVEREGMSIERTELMKPYIGEEFDGIVISVMPFGMFVEIKEMFVEGLVPKDSIPNWRNRWFDIGQKLRIKVVAADLEKRGITLNLVS
ncbi:MAG: VacB/RNase II family 3'-5' exoribonuclease [Thermodesulfobacteriales bacterium]|jgi:ribonuclease R|nr:MAG: VacB/RNase II family 3'-5' exoribonuclease [Thermodesulfobacteriales bacterium]